MLTTKLIYNLGTWRDLSTIPVLKRTGKSTELVIELILIQAQHSNRINEVSVSKNLWKMDLVKKCDLFD